MVVLVGFAACCLLFCGGTSKARPGNYTCYHALVSCNQVGRLCAGDRRVIAIFPPTVRMWHLKEDGRGIRWNDSSNAKQQQSICLPGLGIWPARLLVWMFQLHLDQSRALHGLGPQVFIGPSVVVLPLSCNYETIGSNVPAMQWTAHSSLRWLPAGIWSHCGGREVGSREPGFNGETVNLSHRKERILATDISFSPTNGSHDKLPVDH